MNGELKYIRFFDILKFLNSWEKGNVKFKSREKNLDSFYSRFWNFNGEFFWWRFFYPSLLFWQTSISRACSWPLRWPVSRSRAASSPGPWPATPATCTHPSRSASPPSRRPRRPPRQPRWPCAVPRTPRSACPCPAQSTSPRLSGNKVRKKFKNRPESRPRIEAFLKKRTSKEKNPLKKSFHFSILFFPLFSRSFVLFSIPFCKTV